jgi:altronate dehydratase large subunit
MEFLGYPRIDGLAGTRNFIGIISNGVCTSDAANWIAREVDGCVPFTHRENCSLVSPDKEIITRTLINLGKNPNLAGVLVVSAGCENPGIDPSIVARGVAESGKPVEVCKIHQPGGVRAAISRGMNIAQKMASDASRIKREPLPVSLLRHGVECGGSTPLSGIVTNAAQGTALDFVIENEGSGGFSETPEVIGAEQVIADRAVNDEVKQRMLNAVREYEARLINSGYDLFGSNPDPQNITEGLSSIEEKSVGDVRKGGTKPLMEVVEYGEIPAGKGLFFVNTPGHDIPSVTGLAAAGCNIITYSTECAVPYGFPFVPVIKITAKKEDFEKYFDILDYLVDIERTIKDARSVGKELFDLMLEVASGRKTQNELVGYVGACDLWTVVPMT